MINILLKLMLPVCLNFLMWLTENLGLQLRLTFYFCWTALIWKLGVSRLSTWAQSWSIFDTHFPETGRGWSEYQLQSAQHSPRIPVPPVCADLGVGIHVMTIEGSQCRRWYFPGTPVLWSHSLLWLLYRGKAEWERDWSTHPEASCPALQVTGSATAFVGCHP